MSKASEDALGALHAAVADQLSTIIKDGVKAVDKEGEVVTLAAGPAYFGAAIAFLKNNNITADPSVDEGLQDLQRTLAARRRSRKDSLSGLDEAAAAFAAINGEAMQ